MIIPLYFSFCRIVNLGLLHEYFIGTFYSSKGALILPPLHAQIWQFWQITKHIFIFEDACSYNSLNTFSVARICIFLGSFVLMILNALLLFTCHSTSASQVSLCAQGRWSEAHPDPPHLVEGSLCTWSGDFPSTPMLPLQCWALYIQNSTSTLNLEDIWLGNHNQNCQSKPMGFKATHIHDSLLFRELHPPIGFPSQWMKCVYVCVCV